ncbi:hypothetical protein D1871_15260 [Nakamurella silvestris]|nr:hypothetical protein D1871_15260 [Nakamurella silvestris]
MATTPIVVDVDPQDDATEGNADHGRWNWRDPRNLSAIAVGAITVVFVLIRLGPALFGAKVFGAFDLLSHLSPWTDGLPSAPPTNGILTDSLDSTIPVYLQMHERFTSGDLPLWSSLPGAGNALMANTIKPTLTPTTLWFLVLPTWYALGIAKLAEIVVAVVGMTLWLRRVGAGTAAGILAGLLYCGTGFIVGWSTWTAQAGVAALMPGLFWAIERYLALRTTRGAIPIAVMVGLLLLGGFPASAGHAMYAGGLYFLVRIIADRRQHPLAQNLRTVLGGGFALAVGVMLSAVQFLPLVSQLSETDLDYRNNQFFVQLPSQAALNTVFPGSFFKTGYGGFNNVEAFAYVGVAALVLGLVAVITPRRKVIATGVVSFLAIGTVFTASLLWYQGFWTDWLADLPIFNANLSIRFRDLLSLFTCALAGIGAHLVFHASRESRMRKSTVWTLIGLGLGLTIMTFMVSDAFREKINLTMLFGEFLVGALIIGTIVLAAITARRGTRAALFVVVAVLAMVQVGQSVSNYWPLSDKKDFYPQLAVIDSLKETTGEGRMLPLGSTMRGSTAAAYGIRNLTAHNFQPDAWKDLILALDETAIVAPGSETNPVIKIGVVQDPGTAELLDRLAVTSFLTKPNQTVPGPTMMLDGTPEPAAGISLGSIVRVDPAAPISVPIAPQPVRAVFVHIQGDVPGGEDGQITVGARISDATGTVLASGLVTAPALKAGSIQIPVPGEDLGTRTGPLTLTVTSDQALDVGGFADGTIAARVTGDTGDGVTLVAADAHGQVWSREGALPRIRWAGTAEVLTDPAKNLARLKDPTLPADTVVLSADGPLGGGGSAALRVTEDTGDGVVTEIDAQTAGYLVVGDWMQRGWRVSVDGTPAPLVTADHAFGGVYVEAGHHTVSFHYVGERLKTGLLITVVALLILVLMALAPWLNRLRRRRSGAAAVATAAAVPLDPTATATAATGPLDATPAQDQPEQSAPAPGGAPPAVAPEAEADGTPDEPER